MALILLAASCLAADKPVSDDVIYDQVRIKLSGDPIAKGGSFTVDVKQGVVTSPAWPRRSSRRIAPASWRRR